MARPPTSGVLALASGDGCSTRAQGVRGDGPPLRGVGLLFISGECSEEERYKEERESMRGGLGNPISLLIGAIVVVMLIIILLRFL